MKRSLFITGGSGMLGSVLVRHFQDAGYVVRAPSQAEFDILDQHNPEPCDAIIHCAAVTDVNYCEQNKKICGAVNTEGTKHMLDFARASGAKLVYISTPMVFSGKHGNYRETDRTSPINYYGWTKREAERLVMKYPRGLVIRANPIGIRPPGALPSFIQWFVDAATTNKSFSLFSDVRINPISTETIAMVLEKLLLCELKDRTLHVGSNDVANKADIWEYVKKRFPRYSGTVTRTTVAETPAGKIAKRPKEMWLNVDRIQKEYNISMPSWREEVDRVRTSNTYP